MNDAGVRPPAGLGKEWIHPHEAAERLGVDVVVIYQRLLAGEIAGARDPDRRILIRAADLTAEPD